MIGHVVKLRDCLPVLLKVSKVVTKTVGQRAQAQLSTKQRYRSASDSDGLQDWIK